MTAWAGPFKKFMNPKRKKYSNKSAKAEVREKNRKHRFGIHIMKK